MGEEKKEEEKKPEEEKKEESKEEKKEEEKKEEEKKEEEKPPEEIVLKVDMHCEGCAKKVGRSLKGFPGVEGVETDYKTHKAVVKGKTADPIKVCERIQKKTGRKVELISPLPKPPEEEKKEEEKKEEKKDEPPPVITVLLQVRMHCDACAQVIQKRIRKIAGVESVETDLANNLVVVKGVIDPPKLVESVYKKTGKLATIIPQEEKKEEEKKEEGKKEEVKEEEKKEEEKKEGEEGKDEDDKKADIKKYEHWPKHYYYTEYVHAPQIFSDENPNACSVM